MFSSARPKKNPKNNKKQTKNKKIGKQKTRNKMNKTSKKQKTNNDDFNGSGARGEVKIDVSSY